MIKENVLKFGYGDIAVNSDSFIQTIRFQQFKPPGECGKDVPQDAEYIGEGIVLKISYKEYCEFNEQLNAVLYGETNLFEFKGYVFDFTNYNEESVKVCKNRLSNAMKSYFMCMAC